MFVLLADPNGVETEMVKHGLKHSGAARDPSRHVPGVGGDRSYMLAEMQSVDFHARKRIGTRLLLLVELKAIGTLI